jgi:hypothetical protein
MRETGNGIRASEVTATDMKQLRGELASLRGFGQSHGSQPTAHSGTWLFDWWTKIRKGKPRRRMAQIFL